MQMTRGMRDKLDKYINISEPLEIEIETIGAAQYDYSCFGVDEKDKLSDDRYMIFYNQTNSPNGEIKYLSQTNGAKFSVNLSKLPSKINKLVFTASIDGAGVMRDISSHKVVLKQGNKDVLDLNLSGKDFGSERAVISIEIYNKNGWRINAVARGFNGGLSELLKFFGGEEAAGDRQSSVNQKDPAPREPSNVNKPVILKKGEKVKLKKEGYTNGEIIINLNWSSLPQKTGFFSFGSQGIDLDLGCLFMLKDGSKGTVQALGNSFGSLDYPPYISLDGDDRTGDVAGGETLRVNGGKISEIEKILVYTFIYEGVTNWQSADGVVTIKCPGSPNIIIKMDEYATSKRMCALALLENDSDKTFTVEKIVRFFNGHKDMDHAFHWGLRWTPGRK